MTHFSIKQWPQSERPRERLLAQGAQRLSDAELLAIILGSGQRGCSAVDQARRALAAFGGLKSLMHANLAAHKSHKSGFGPARFAALQAAQELARRLLGSAIERGTELNTPQALGDFFKLSLAQSPTEVFAVLALDLKLRKIAYAELFQGTIDRAPVYTGEVVRFALKHHAYAIVLAHNHPSGVAEPSACDVKMTLRLRDALALVDVRLIDHFIVGDSVPTSLVQRGLL